MLLFKASEINVTAQVKALASAAHVRATLELLSSANMSVNARAYQLACRESSRVSSRGVRRYATQGSLGSSKTPSRRAITVTSDDGRYAWGELSTGEKAARTTQQTFNFLLVGAGLAGTVSVSSS